MAEDSGGGGPSWAFGSRFNGLELDLQESDWKTKHNNKNYGKKRTANRTTQRENQFMKLLKVDNQNGPRFLILQRTDKDQTMKTVSPFFIRKAMDCISPNVTISRTREGGLLLKTVDRQQAEKLMKQKVLGGTVNIEVTEHPTLNQSRGTIFCPDLNMHTDEEIASELKDVHVTEVKRVKRRNRQGELEDSGKFILTFDLGSLPRSIDAGIHACRVEQHVPPPLRCMNCLKFGHKKQQCKGNQICASCANLYHDKSECQQGLKCVVCREAHHTLSKKCPVYLDEKEIQRLKVTEKITYREARQKRRSQAPDPNPPKLKPTQTFSSLFKTQTQQNTVDQGNSSNCEPTLPTTSQASSSTQMNLTTTNNEKKNDTLTLIRTTNIQTNPKDNNIQQQNTEPQKKQISALKNSTNTSTTIPFAFEMNPFNPNLTNTKTEFENHNNRSQTMTQPIDKDEEHMNDNEL